MSGAVLEQSMDMSGLISTAIAAKMTPQFVEQEVNTRVEKLIVESIDRALRTYSDTGKLIKKAIEEALHVDRIDLPSYGATVSGMVKEAVEARVSELVAGRLAADIDELLNLAPKEVKLSAIADEMRQQHDGHEYGPVITVIVEHNDHGSAWIYLDEGDAYEGRDKYRCAHRLLVGSDGKIASATISGKDIKSAQHIGRAYGLEQKVRAFVACGTTIVLDEDNVVTSVGDY